MYVAVYNLRIAMFAYFSGTGGVDDQTLLEVLPKTRRDDCKHRQSD
jgi:hypothetical protein